MSDGDDCCLGLADLLVSASGGRLPPSSGEESDDDDDIFADDEEEKQNLDSSNVSTVLRVPVPG